ncbi:hypothetical protein HK405_014534, partial [Cladochytrium tenue]
MPTVDQIIYFITIGELTLLLAFALQRLWLARTAVTYGGLASTLLMLGRLVAITAYSFLTWQKCQGRYFMNFFCLLASKTLLYVLHERRLALFLASRSADASGTRARTAIRVVILTMLVAYVGAGISQVAISCVYCYNTSTGGNSLTAQEATNVKYAVYSLEIALGLALLAGNIYALSSIMNANKAAGIASTSTYTAILGSDAVRFVAVLPVEMYKLAYSYDPSGASGFFPTGSGNGNAGLQAILDAYKISLLLLLLYFPSAYAKMKTKNTSGGSGAKS